MQIKIKYFNKNIDKLKYIGGAEKSNWIDLRAAETVILKAGDFALVPLGIAMKLPEGYEAHIAPRSSTFKNYGIIMTNSVGVVDTKFSATRDTVIKENDRICQFRIVECQPEIEFKEVEKMEDPDRGGFGSTGV